MTFFIFIASMVHNSWPCATVSPGLTLTATITPGSGALTALPVVTGAAAPADLGAAGGVAGGAELRHARWQAATGVVSVAEGRTSCTSSGQTSKGSPSMVAMMGRS